MRFDKHLEQWYPEDRQEIYTCDECEEGFDAGSKYAVTDGCNVFCCKKCLEAFHGMDDMEEGEYDE
jgi:hypothetical protein